jgi:hypothetical protein
MSLMFSEGNGMTARAKAGGGKLRVRFVEEAEGGLE